MVESIMDLKSFAIVFGTVFLAELGDKTQLAKHAVCYQDAGPLFILGHWRWLLRQRLRSCSGRQFPGW
jgi:putative Ca2+/H+ antiporter (TMEM165/GDT1 family)